MSAQKRHVVYKDDRDRSRETGESIRALCGRVWVPELLTEDELMARPVCKHCERSKKRIESERLVWSWRIVSTEMFPDTGGVA